MAVAFIASKKSHLMIKSDLYWKLLNYGTQTKLRSLFEQKALCVVYKYGWFLGV